MNIKASKIRSRQLVVLFAALLIWIFAQGIQEVYSHEFPSVPHELAPVPHELAPVPHELAPVPYEGELKKPWKIAYDTDSHKIIIDLSPLNSLKSLKDIVIRDINKFIKEREIVPESYSLKEINLQLNSSEQSSEGSGNNNWKISYLEGDLSAADSDRFDFRELDNIEIPYERFNDLQKVETVAIKLKINLIFTNEGKLDEHLITSIYTYQVGSDIKEALQDQIINYSHQTLDLHDLDKHSLSHKKRHLMAVALAGLAYEVATIATDAAVTLENLATLLVGLKSLQSHTCKNSDNAYAYNQKKEVCKSLSDNSIDVYEDIIKPYTTVAELFHEDPNSKLRMNETDGRIYIYLPDGNNIALPRDDVEKGDELGEKYKKFKTNFTKTANFECIVEGRQCGVFTYDKETLNEAYKNVYQLIEDIQSDSKIVMYHKDSLICDAPIEVRRQLMQSSAKKPPRQTWIKEAAPKGNANKSHETRTLWCEDDEDEDEEYTVFGVSKADAQAKKDECLKKNQSLTNAINAMEIDDDNWDRENLSMVDKYINEKTECSDDRDYAKKPQRIRPILSRPNQDEAIAIEIEKKYFHDKCNSSEAQTYKIQPRKEPTIETEEKRPNKSKQSCCYDTGTGCSMQ
jgi:hypothetical protein